MPSKRVNHRYCKDCGVKFKPTTNTQKYCSPRCRTHWGKTHPPVHTNSPFLPIVRTFLCSHCGQIVYVNDLKDKRTRFCSYHCEKLYWKHSKELRGKYATNDRPN